ncbi:MAG: 6-pyruvoyl trahydropterin synthase family protein [Pseudomonadota bacterium]
MELFVEFEFDAAHYFEHKPLGHKHRRLHGHSFRVEVAVRGWPDPETGVIVDFEELESAVAQLRDQLDHNFLNEIEGLRVPSLENIAIWVWTHLKPKFAALTRVVVRRDSCRQGCSLSGDPEVDSALSSKSRREPAGEPNLARACPMHASDRFR